MWGRRWEGTMSTSEGLDVDRFVELLAYIEDVEPDLPHAVHEVSRDPTAG